MAKLRDCSDVEPDQPYTVGAFLRMYCAVSPTGTGSHVSALTVFVVKIQTSYSPKTWTRPTMPNLDPIEYEQASPVVRAVYDDIMATRNTDWVNNFWKVLAHHPDNLQRIWNNIKQVMGNGALDPLTKEMIYVAISITNNCGYCIASHSAGARAKGMTEAQYGELMAVVGLANETNRLAVGYGVPIDEVFKLK